MWSSMYSAYDALSPAMKNFLEGMTAVHDAEDFREQSAKWVFSHISFFQQFYIKVSNADDSCCVSTDSDSHCTPKNEDTQKMSATSYKLSIQ